MRPPGFWAGSPDSVPATVLGPLGALVGAITARRASRRGFRASARVICCGNATLGGAGKTIVVLDLAQRLAAMGKSVNVLSRGYGGSTRGPHRVTPDDDSAAVGDEALLLAAVAPTWVGADRAASARAAIADGAEVLLLDDGLQNPTLAKDVALLVIDAGFGFGNARVFPAGPLREPIAAAASRCQAAVLIGPDRTDVAAMLPASLPVLRARLIPGPEIAALAGRPVLAFAGIGRPDKFFATLTEAGVRLIATAPFADHHRYRTAEIERLLARAASENAVPVTTAKDAVRLPPALRARVAVVGVSLRWDDADALESILHGARRG
ncbi:MAG: tetraacyldisaccharide 4'-kinase [Acetobacteraceae bacterium]